MPEAVLGLGGNLGARRALFNAAIALLDAQPGCRVLARSRLYETPPLGPPQPDYLNAAVRLRFEGEVSELLSLLQRIEGWLGRERRVRWGARTVDLDVLYWSGGPVLTAALQVPHRELGARSFALAPLLDVAPELALEWESTLHALGGPPPLAEPGWPELVREGTYVCGSWSRDDGELASQLVELLAACEPLSERLALAAAHEARLSTHAFTGPSELFDTDGRSWLTAAVSDALGRGFAVQRAAVVERDETRTAGLLLGYDSGPPAQLGLPPVSLEEHPDRGRRVKMAREAPEHGFDFNGSGTM
jgi:2-amino-4-hydroxy-6-hydroxymethyldihydropteridine diphosphokinase